MRDREVTSLWRAEVDRALRVHAPHLSAEQRERATEELVGAQVAAAPGVRVPTLRGYRAVLAFERLRRLVREGAHLRHPISVLARLCRCDRASVRRWLPELTREFRPGCPPRPSRIRS